MTWSAPILVIVPYPWTAWSGLRQLKLPEIFKLFPLRDEFAKGNPNLADQTGPKISTLLSSTLPSCLKLGVTFPSPYWFLK